MEVLCTLPGELLGSRVQASPLCDSSWYVSPSTNPSTPPPAPRC